MKLAFRSFLVGAATAQAISTYSANLLLNTKTSACQLIEPIHETQLHRGLKTTADVIQIQNPRQNLATPDDILAKSNISDQTWLEILGGSPEAILSVLQKRCPQGALQSNQLEVVAATTPVIRKIVDSGDPKNRIDIVFMGDGYTTAEEPRFFDDIQRLTNDMFTGDTFTQYLPLFNVWAVFVPSAQSGIGVGGKPLDTAFGLYRDGTELRGVYTTKAQYARD
ncbi:hypothetical protein As57867_006335, partial [Aphanomyces stellatus]